MVKFAHLADIHLGGWRQEPLQELNLQAFKKAIEICVKEKVDFVIIAGDLFDSAYPPIEILKETFKEFRKLKEAKIPCFLVPGSHDYSVSGKTFLDVLENAGFCERITNLEEIDDKVILNPLIYGGVAIYGYPGKKSGLEIPDLRKIKINNSPGLFKILILHTTIDKAKGELPIDAIEADLLPKMDYYALGHLHINFQYKNFIYPGPLFPNNFQELKDLKYGGFYIVDTNSQELLRRVEVKTKDVIFFDFEIKNSLIATEEVISELKKNDLEDKIVLIKVRGELEKGENSDIKFSQIEEFAKSKGAYFLLRNTHDLKTKEIESNIEVEDINNLENEYIEIYSNKNPSPFNKFISQLIDIFSTEKQEGETNENFSKRLLDEAKKILNF